MAKSKLRGGKKAHRKRIQRQKTEAENLRRAKQKEFDRLYKEAMSKTMADAMNKEDELETQRTGFSQIVGEEPEDIESETTVSE